MHISTPMLRTALVAAIAALIGWAPADAESGRRAGIVTALHGTATVSRASLAAPRALRFRDEVMLQDRITTGEESLARILLGGKAVITVRERSVVTITELPRVSTVDVEAGKIALAVAKERLAPGDSIQLRTPNAVAGIRGTVVIAEVTGRGADTTTRFTLLTGVIDVVRVDAAGRPVGASAVLNPLQTISVDRALSPVRSLTRAEGATASSEFQLPIAAPRRGAEWVAKDQVTQALAIADPDRARSAPRLDAKPDKPGKPDVGGKPAVGGKPDIDDRSERMQLPVTAPPSPVVPPAALQASGKGKGKEKDR